MRLTTKARFAVTAMLDIALHSHGKPVSLTQISERQQITVAYLEQIFCKLRRNHLVKSMRGPGGGYFLAKNASEITIGRIINAVEEDIDATQCRGDGTCMGGASCLTHHLWEQLNEVTAKFLNEITLASMVQEHVVHEEHPTRTTIPADIPVSKVSLRKPRRGRPHSRLGMGKHRDDVEA